MSDINKRDRNLFEGVTFIFCAVMIVVILGFFVTKSDNSSSIRETSSDFISGRGSVEVKEVKYNNGVHCYIAESTGMAEFAMECLVVESQNK